MFDMENYTSRLAATVAEASSRLHYWANNTVVNYYVMCSFVHYVAFSVVISLRVFCFVFTTTLICLCFRSPGPGCSMVVRYMSLIVGWQ